MANEVKKEVPKKETPKKEQQHHAKKEKKQIPEEQFIINFSDLITKVTVTKSTPHGLLGEWAKEYNLENVQVVVKLNEEF